VPPLAADIGGAEVALVAAAVLLIAARRFLLRWAASRRR
jgi:hypothetical protein